jgi:hypothetical protein
MVFWGCGNFQRKDKNMKKLLVKYGRHFWLVPLSVTIYTIYDYLFNNADCSDIVMLSFITYLFFIDRNGKPEEK